MKTLNRKEADKMTTKAVVDALIQIAWTMVIASKTNEHYIEFTKDDHNLTILINRANEIIEDELGVPAEMYRLCENEFYEIDNEDSLSIGEAMDTALTVLTTTIEG